MTTTRPRTSRVIDRALTLVEVLLAGAAVALLAVLCLGLVQDALRHWHRQAGRLAAHAQAQRIFEQLSHDLQNAFFRADGQVWLAATVLPDTTTSGQWEPAPVAVKPARIDLTPDDLGSARHGVAGIWLRFITLRTDSQTDRSSLTAPVAVGYQIVRRAAETSRGEARYLLFRAEVRRTATATAPGTFQAGYDLDPARGGPYTVPQGTQGDPGNLRRPNLDDVLAENVIDFGLRFYVWEDGRLRLTFPANATGQLEGSAREYLAGGGVGPERAPFPEVVEVMVHLLTEEGARRLAALERGRGPGDWSQVESAHAHRFTHRVVLGRRGR